MDKLFIGLFLNHVTHFCVTTQHFNGLLSAVEVCGLEKVEREDEFVLENVHKGIRSYFYKPGRFSPTREKGVRHFHRLLSTFLNR